MSDEEILPEETMEIPEAPNGDLVVRRNWLRLPLPFRKQPTYETASDAVDAYPFPGDTEFDDLLLEYSQSAFEKREEDRKAAGQRCVSLLQVELGIVGGQLAFIRLADGLTDVAYGLSLAGTILMLVAIAVALFSLRMPLRASRAPYLAIERDVHFEERMKLYLARVYYVGTVATGYDIERIAFVLHGSLLTAFVGVSVFAAGALWR